MIPNTKIEPLKEYFDELSEHLKAHGFMLVVADVADHEQPYPKWTFSIVPTVEQLKTTSSQEGTLAHLCWKITTQNHDPYPFIYIALVQDIHGRLLKLTRTENTIHLEFRVSRRNHTLNRNPIWV